MATPCNTSLPPVQMQEKCDQLVGDRDEANTHVAEWKSRCLEVNTISAELSDELHQHKNKLRECNDLNQQLEARLQSATAQVRIHLNWSHTYTWCKPEAGTTPLAGPNRLAKCRPKRMLQRTPQLLSACGSKWPMHRPAHVRHKSSSRHGVKSRQTSSTSSQLGRKPSA